jgi:hypothetical protein
MEWLLQWRPVIDHSIMKKVKEMAQTRSIPIWRDYTADIPAKTNVTRHVSTRKHVLPKRMSNNPLTDVFSGSKTSRSTSKAPPTIQMKTKGNNILTKMFKTLGKRRSTSRVQPVLEVLDQCIDDRLGDVPT